MDRPPHRGRTRSRDRPCGPGNFHTGGQPPMSRINVAIAGVGNCASSLVQGVEYYKDASPDDRVPGLMHVNLGGYHVRDVSFVAAFDVDTTKVGLDLGKAIFAG